MALKWEEGKYNRNSLRLSAIVLGFGNCNLNSLVLLLYIFFFNLIHPIKKGAFYK